MATNANFNTAMVFETQMDDVANYDQEPKTNLDVQKSNEYTTLEID
jgi:hypothetical protein